MSPFTETFPFSSNVIVFGSVELYVFGKSLKLFLYDFMFSLKEEETGKSSTIIVSVLYNQEFLSLFTLSQELK
tara:strand:+ start:1330 stop:1548 length:219 start_codon:yes stop_codon:yes gene_type:complete